MRMSLHVIYIDRYRFYFTVFVSFSVNEKHLTVTRISDPLLIFRE